MKEPEWLMKIAAVVFCLMNYSLITSWQIDHKLPQNFHNYSFREYLGSKTTCHSEYTKQDTSLRDG